MWMILCCWREIRWCYKWCWMSWGSAQYSGNLGSIAGRARLMVDRKGRGGKWKINEEKMANVEVFNYLGVV